ncbi:hypothetical protein [Neobacillus massiliamazoniensis]|nr:hypothetical protein [Neobacillus massiliamazoniensis]
MSTPKPGKKRRKGSLITIINDRNQLESRKKVVERAGQRPKLVGKEEKGR